METTKSNWQAIRPVAHLFVAVFLFYASMKMTAPFLVDVYVDAVCEDHTECSQVISVMGVQQAIWNGSSTASIIGFGAVVMAPILGSISDDYGRKPVFRIVLFVAILPSVILAYKRSQMLMYVWFSLLLPSAILRDAGLVPAALAYVADVVDERHRASAVGFTLAAITSGTLVGTVVAYFLKADYYDFWIAAGLQISAAIYLQLFLKESNPKVVLRPAELSRAELTTKFISKPVWKRQYSSIVETARIVWKNRRLRTIAFVHFTNSCAMAGMQSFLLYFLRAKFDFGKDEYAVIVIFEAVTSVFGRTFAYPVMANIFGEREVLWIALAGSAGQYFLYSFAWAGWVPYIAATAGIFPSFVYPALSTMVSRGLHHEQQGKIQGFMGAVRAVAVIIATLVLTPLAAISMIDDPPMQMPGLTFAICGTAIVVAWLVSLGVPVWPHKPTERLQEPLLPDYTIDVQPATRDALQEPINPEAPEFLITNKNDDTEGGP